MCFKNLMKYLKHTVLSIKVKQHAYTVYLYNSHFFLVYKQLKHGLTNKKYVLTFHIHNANNQVIHHQECSPNSLLISRDYTCRESGVPQLTDDWVVCIYKPVCIHNYSSDSPQQNLLIHLVVSRFHFTRHFSLCFGGKFTL